MHTDPVADMLTRIRNGCRARLERVDVPRSKLKVNIAQILKREGFIDDFREISDTHQGVLEIKLRYDDLRTPAIVGLNKVSKSGMRKYMGWDEIPKVRGGLGVLILTTSQGLMTDRDARAKRVGGEALCEVW